MTRQAPNGYRFPPVIISHAVWLYHRFCLSFRDADDLLAQRSIRVTLIGRLADALGPLAPQQARHTLSETRGASSLIYHLTNPAGPPSPMP